MKESFLNINSERGFYFVLEINIALQGKAYQSSDYLTLGGAEHAIDGNSDGNYNGGRSCTHTTSSTNPWWRVDLHKPYRISRVFVANRGDCCEQRLLGAEVHVGNSLNNNGNDNPKCGTKITSTTKGKVHIFNCANMEGRYVSIIIPGQKKVLTLCEVEIYGATADRQEEESCF
nr:PREDICTED: fucolectin-like [Latimeria chalumnae]|eukprot:XP_014349317.1 PREDICTED: fucolectin-like [Latimeria chalumnae]